MYFHVIELKIFVEPNFGRLIVKYSKEIKSGKAFSSSPKNAGYFIRKKAVIWTSFWNFIKMFF